LKLALSFWRSPCSHPQPRTVSTMIAQMPCTASRVLHLTMTKSGDPMPQPLQLSPLTLQKSLLWSGMSTSPVYDDQDRTPVAECMTKQNKMWLADRNQSHAYQLYKQSFSHF
jgi:hypothetical protein